MLGMNNIRTLQVQIGALAQAPAQPHPFESKARYPPKARMSDYPRPATLKNAFFGAIYVVLGRYIAGGAIWT